MEKLYLLCCFMIYGIVMMGQNSVKLKPNSNYFPIAVWLQNPTRAAEYKANGVNMFVGLWNDLDQSQLDYLRAANMKVICAQNSFGLGHLNDTIIYAWMHGDEPDNAQWNKTTQKYDPCIDPKIIIKDYESIKNKDPSRPVYLNVGQGVAYLNYIGRGACSGNIDSYKVSTNGYLKGCDIGSFDIYPVNSEYKEIKNNLWYIAKGVDSLKSWSNHSKPVWCWIETTRISKQGERKPTAQEVKSEVWMALIHGVKGFGYFCHSFSPTSDEAALLHDINMMNAVKEINLQVTSLAFVLNSNDLLGYATASSSNSLVPIDMMIKKQGKSNYIFAVAMRNGETTATITVTSGTNVEVLGENRSIHIVKGKFNDSFSSYGVHLYKITK
jgi:hypothetical protein